MGDLTHQHPPVERIPEDDLAGPLLLVGEDGNDGLIAVLRSRRLEAFLGDGDITDDYVLHGFILEGEIPPPPDEAFTR